MKATSPTEPVPALDNLTHKVKKTLVAWEQRDIFLGVRPMHENVQRLSTRPWNNLIHNSYGQRGLDPDSRVHSWSSQRPCCGLTSGLIVGPWEVHSQEPRSVSCPLFRTDQGTEPVIRRFKEGPVCTVRPQWTSAPMGPRCDPGSYTDLG